jgi:uncharacterized membrane protein YkvA (DUF1232 family)
MNVADVIAYFRSRDVPTWRKLIGVFAGLYVLFPFDAIPDVFPIVGWLDDVGVVGAAMTFLAWDMKRRKALAAKG